MEASDCSLVLLDARSGKLLNAGKDPWLRPKHSDPALGMFLLGPAGLPAGMPPGECVLPWAHNTRDTHGISFRLDSTLDGGSSWEEPNRSSVSSSTHGGGSFAEATSFPASEASSTGARFGTSDSERKQRLEDRSSAEQPGQKWLALAAKVNSESTSSQAEGQHALRMSLLPEGSPAAQDKPSAGHCSPGPASPRAQYESPGGLPTCPTDTQPLLCQG